MYVKLYSGRHLVLFFGNESPPGRVRVSQHGVNIHLFAFIRRGLCWDSIGYKAALMDLTLLYIAVTCLENLSFQSTITPKYLTSLHHLIFWPLMQMGVTLRYCLCTNKTATVLDVLRDILQSTNHFDVIFRWSCKSLVA